MGSFWHEWGTFSGFFAQNFVVPWSSQPPFSNSYKFEFSKIRVRTIPKLNNPAKLVPPTMCDPALAVLKVHQIS